ncbi:MAG: IS66 family transposase [Candidatus Eisenbacteria bacterium]|nr:IS66 family transposase [Candidatus Eisenbacteria bacterium]
MAHATAKRLEVKVDDLDKALERIRSQIDEEDYQTLAGGVEALAYLSAEIQKKGASIRRLRQLIFGPSSEKTDEVRERLGEQKNEESGEEAGEEGSADSAGGEGSGKGQKKKRKGHGRNGVDAYPGAERIDVSHDTLRPGDPCPIERCDGRVYRQKEPHYDLRVIGRSPITASVIARERLRCALCGVIFTAGLPPGAGEKKYDESVVAMIAYLRFGAGFPHYRLERIQESFGIPMPSSTQWELIRDGALEIEAVFEQLIVIAAGGEVLHNDDTPGKIIELITENKERKKAIESGEVVASSSKNKNPEDRTAIYTSGVISVTEDGHRIALFFTGREHAGENLARVLEKRPEELPAPIHMSDGLAANTPGELARIIANCLVHARRHFVEVAENFPDEVLFILECLKLVYRYDEEAKKASMTPEERLLYHQEKSAPVMKKIEEWLDRQIADKLVEPNSGLGEAIRYMQKRWDALTLFLRKPGAPLDNNIVERGLKKAILHRNNSRFYKTKNGARVGDLYTSLIHTAELAGADPFHYLTELLRHAAEARECPAEWMPWNYLETLERLKSRAPPGE